MGDGGTDDGTAGDDTDGGTGADDQVDDGGMDDGTAGDDFDGATDDDVRIDDGNVATDDVDDSTDDGSTMPLADDVVDNGYDDAGSDDSDNDDTSNDRSQVPPVDDIVDDDVYDDDDDNDDYYDDGPANDDTDGDDYYDDELVAPLDDNVGDGTVDNDDSGAAEVCGCQECTASVLDRDAGGFSCGARIAYLQSPEGGSQMELEACAAIGTEYPGSCTPCNPIMCDGRAPTFCGCGACTLQVWGTVAGGFTCGARIMYLQTSAGGSETMEDACFMVAEAFPEECGVCDPINCI